MIKNKKGLIDGTVKRPVKNEDEQQQWDRCNTLVKTWLLSAMSKEISGSVMHCKHAAGIWYELKERFSHTNTVQLFYIENAIRECQQDSSSVTSFFNKLKGLWDEKDSLCAFPACTCEAAPEVKAYMDTQKTMQFLMGLNESFGALRSNVITLDPLPAVNKVYAMALRHEKQANASNERAPAPVEASAFNVKKFNKQPTQFGGEKRCEICNYTNHSTKNCRAHIKCTYCNGQGHTQETCRRKRNARINQASSSNEDMSDFPFSKSECHQMMGLLNKMKNGGAQADGNQLLEMMNTVKQSAVNVVGNTPNYEELSGNAKKHSKNTSWILDSGASDHIACDIALLSIYKPVHNRFVKLPNGSTLRVSHVGTVRFSKVFNSFPFLANKSCTASNCHICRLAKLTKQPFPLSISSSVCCFELIHVDIWGGYHIPTLSGAQYFLTIVDDHSRNTWVYLMKHKSEARKLLINFIILVENQFGKRVKTVRSDN